MSSSSISGECRLDLFSRALSTRACASIFLASSVRGGSRATVVGRGLFRLGALSGCGVLELANVVPMTPTPAMAIWYSASLGSPAGGLDASI